jgi:hypothetical protein
MGKYCSNCVCVILGANQAVGVVCKNSENYVSMVYKWLQFCARVVIRFTWCSKILIVKHVEKFQDQLETISRKHIMEPGTIL